MPKPRLHATPRLVERVLTYFFVCQFGTQVVWSGGHSQTFLKFVGEVSVPWALGFSVFHSDSQYCP